MPDIEYTPEDLRAGSRQAADGGASAAAAAGWLHGIDPSSPYGDVAGSQVLHDAVIRAREHHRVMLALAAEGLDELSTRADRTAALGDANTGATTRLSVQGELSTAISDRM